MHAQMDVSTASTLIDDAKQAKRQQAAPTPFQVLALHDAGYSGAAPKTRLEAEEALRTTLNNIGTINAIWRARLAKLGVACQSGKLGKGLGDIVAAAQRKNINISIKKLLASN